MAAILISAHDGPYYAGSSTTLTLRVYSQNDTWTTREGVTVQQGDGINPWCRDYSCPVTAGIPAIPDLAIYSTVDRIEQYLDPQWAAIWLDNGVLISPGSFYFQGYRVPPTPTTTSKVALDIFTAATNNNRPLVNAPITVADAMALFPQLTGIAANQLVKAVNAYPAQVEGSVWHDDGTIAGFGGLTDSFPGLQRNAENPAKLEAVKAGGGGFQNLVSGAVQMNWGRISSQPITLDFNTTVPQSICEPPDGHSGVVTALLFYDNTVSLVTSDQTMNIGIESGGASYADAVAVTDLGLGNAIKRNYYLLLPAAESQIIPDGKSLQLTLSGLFGGAVEVQCQPFGVIL